jgi:hypothetical protein
MNKRIVKAAGIAVGFSVIAFVFIQYKTEYAITQQLDKAVAQQLDYEDMQASLFGSKIEFDHAVVKSLDSSAGEFNFKAKKLSLDVDYTNALLRNFQVKGIEAQGVTLAFDYAGIGDSNIHDIQKNLRNYIQSRKEENKASVQWDVYTIELRDVTVILNDFQYGNIGTFVIDSLTIPHVSSKYSGKDNRDILFLAVAKELSKQFMDEQIQGEYDKGKFTRFIAREARSELGSFLNGSKNKLGSKMRSFWQKLNNPQTTQPDADET